jgi:hypothetical protein
MKVIKLMVNLVHTKASQNPRMTISEWHSGEWLVSINAMLRTLT